QFALEFRYETAAVGLRRVLWTRATSQHNVRREGIGPHRDHAPFLRCSHRPGSRNLEACTDEGLQHRFPAGRSVYPVAVAIARLLLVRAAFLVVLLERVIDGERKPRIHLLAQRGERLAESTLEVFLRLLLVAVETLGRRDQFRLLGYE